MGRKPYTVTMTGTYWVMATDENEARDIMYESILRIPTVDERIEDAECHWANAMIIEGFYSTIIRDGEKMSDYDARLQYLAGLSEHEKGILRIAQLMYPDEAEKAV